MASTSLLCLWERSLGNLSRLEDYPMIAHLSQALVAVALALLLALLIGRVLCRLNLPRVTGSCNGLGYDALSAFRSLK